MSGEPFQPSAGTADYLLCGWRVRSAVPLPEVMRWPGDDRAPDIAIRLGSAPPLRDQVGKGVGPVQVGRDGVCRLDIKNVATYLVAAGRDVVVEPRIGVDAPDLRNWLLGVALGMLCHLRGLFPLHAARSHLRGTRASANRHWRRRSPGAATG
jgi:hypothetical protein